MTIEKLITKLQEQPDKTLEVVFEDEIGLVYVESVREDQTRMLHGKPLFILSPESYMP